DEHGKEVYTKEYNTTNAYSSMDVNLGNVPSETYLVVIYNSAGQVVCSKKIVVYHY
ncbi:MAG: hypothetical protein HZB42_14675, partial [Sphingobacteriales bacterium]|nr:hypothetical protein [Sphingobacteriales bacterium]MBI5858873.1 hypothetical protein [Sphingobacteriales bacterium]